MATRAEIKVEGVNYCKLYKHYDGYPDGTLKWLEDFNQIFIQKRGNDHAYKMAQLIRSSAIDAKKYELDQSRYTGWGIEPFDVDCGVQFEYILKDDGTVEVNRK